jgi:alpha-N-acetylglucosamine transferase
MFFDRASWYINESKQILYSFLSMFVRSQCLYMFRALLVHLQEALKCTMYNTYFQYLSLQHVITPKSICAEPPEDGRVTLEICRGIDC